jgi:hypothetical protein
MTSKCWIDGTKCYVETASLTMIFCELCQKSRLEKLRIQKGAL